MNKINIPIPGKIIIWSLQSHGFQAYVVGGCVRDSLLGLKPHDWDICTSATPEEVKAVFPNHIIIETGIKHGTVTIVMEDQNYEVTTFRTDGDYSDGRHPDSVSFTDDLVNDLARRDFTMNAMAYNDEVGLVDPFGGMNDLTEGCIHCVGGPMARLREDALRILRALRFKADYGFDLSPSTAAAIHALKDTLINVSAERIQAELSRLVLGKHCLDVLLDYGDVIATIIPELAPCIGFEQNNPYHQYTVYDHIAHAVDNYKGDDIIVKLALLLHDIGKPRCYTEDEKGGHFHGHGIPSAEMASQALKRLRFSNDIHDKVVELVLYHDAIIEPTVKTVRRWLNKIGVEQFYRLLNIRMADIMAHAKGTQEDRIERCNELRQLAAEVIAKNQCFQMKDLAVGGHDIMRLGVPEGPEVGRLLHYLLQDVMDGKVENEKEALLLKASTYLALVR